jgi:tetratricopeptide (TPR) repeat protein
LGKRQEAARKFAEAAEKFAYVVSTAPQHLNALINWGLTLDRIGKPIQAIDKYQQALAQDAKKAAAYYNWGWTLERLRKHQEAVTKYEQALALDAELMTPALQRYLQHHRPPQPEDTRVGPSLPRTGAPR